MRNKDWSLVLFTLLSQLSIGIMLWLTVLTFFSDLSGLEFETGLSLMNPVLIAPALVGIATFSSFLHLGNPSNAPNALNNLFSSWLSREILAINAYVASLLATLLYGLYSTNGELMVYLLLLSSLAGIALLWMMIRVYVIPTIPSWNSWYTPASFALSAICLGLVALLLAHEAGIMQVGDQLWTTLLILLMLTLLLEAASALFHQIKLQTLHSGIDKPKFDQGGYHELFLLRIGMLLVAFLLIFTSVINANALSAVVGPAWLLVTLALIVAQETTGRILFYASYFRLGV